MVGREKVAAEIEEICNPFRPREYSKRRSGCPSQTNKDVFYISCVVTLKQDLQANVGKDI